MAKPTLPNPISLPGVIIKLTFKQRKQLPLLSAGLTQKNPRLCARSHMQLTPAQFHGVMCGNRAPSTRRPFRKAPKS